jgi:hypothetical protein
MRFSGRVGRHYSYQLRTGRRAAILVTEVTSHHYMTKLEVPKKWFMASIDTIMRVYGERLKLTKEDIRLSTYFRLITCWYNGTDVVPGLCFE